MNEILTVGSLFAGIGGLELGLEMSGGFRTKWSVEIDEFANSIRKKHWPNVPQYHDVKAFPPPGKNLKQFKVDVICGGSPCQDFSVAGKRAGLSGERSGLFYEYLRIIRLLQPKYLVWENVRGVLSANGGEDFRTILGEISDSGYDAEWKMLRADQFGHKHARQRIFVVAYSNRFRLHAGPSAQNSIFFVQGDQNNFQIGENRDFASVRLGKDNFRVPAPYDTEGLSGFLSKRPDCWPAIESNICGGFNGVSRKLDSKRIKALGNAVVPQCAMWIGGKIKQFEKHLKK